jgi:hypothetical protein
MGIFSQVTQTLRRLVTEKLLKGLHILSGNGENRPENRPDAPISTDRHDDEPPNTAPIKEDAKIRLSSNRLGGYGNR